jgi:uncharacterized protein YegL
MRVIFPTGGSTQSNKPVIHNVYVLDRSGSMNGKKYEVATSGIISDLQKMAELGTKENVDYTNSVITFDYSYRIETSLWMQKFPIGVVNFPPPVGNTALYDAIGFTLGRLKESMRPGEKAVVTIFTDGGENDSKKYNATRIAAMIKECEELGITTTFVGTKFDTEQVITRLGIHLSNTMTHDNTLESIGATFSFRNEAMSGYTKKLKSGKDVSRGFYKSVEK